MELNKETDAINHINKINSLYQFNDKNCIYLSPYFYEESDFIGSESSLTFPELLDDVSLFIIYWINLIPKEDDLLLFYQYIDKAITKRYNNRMKKWKGEYIALKSTYGKPYELKDDNEDYIKEEAEAKKDFAFPAPSDMQYLIKILAMRYMIYASSALTNSEKEYLLKLNFILPDRKYCNNIDELLKIYAIDFNDFMKIFIFKEYTNDKNRIEYLLEYQANCFNDHFNTIVSQNDRLRIMLAEHFYNVGY